MNLNKENLYKIYITNNMSRKECAQIFKCSDALIKKRLCLYGITKDKEQISKVRSRLYKNVKISRDDLYQKYIVDNMSRQECAEYFGVSEPVLEKRLKLYNIKKNKKAIYKNTQKTILNKYGVDNSCKMASTINKRVQTNLNKYGAKTFAESIYFKKIMTNKAKNRNNYDILWNKELLIKYIKSFDIKPTIYELSQKLNYSYTIVGKHIRDFNLQDMIDSKRSQPNLYWHDLILKELGIDFKSEGYIFGDRQHCDLYYDDKKIGIDINPTASHNTQFNVYTRKPKGNVTVSYHRDRAIKAEKNGWLLYQIYDWDNERKVLNQLKSLLGCNKKIYARNCIFKPIDEQSSKIFLNKYHLQGNIGASYRYGLFYNGVLVAVMTFGKSRFYRNAQYELLRYCSCETIVGGASKLFNGFIKEQNPKSIITYSDMSKGTGNLYSKLGFLFKGYAALNGIYAPERPTGEHLKTQEASREFRKHKGEFKTCKEYFNHKRWYRINDAGSKIWVWINSNYNSEN